MDFYEEWMKLEKYWFNSNKELDEYLTNKYENLLINDNPIIQIIIYDQLTRHIYRKEYASHIITYFNQKALKIANENKHLIPELSYNDWMFFILVYRHSNIRENLFLLWKKHGKDYRNLRNLLKRHIIGQILKKNWYIMNLMIIINIKLLMKIFLNIILKRNYQF